MSTKSASFRTVCGVSTCGMSGLLPIRTALRAVTHAGERHPPGKHLHEEGTLSLGEILKKDAVAYQGTAPLHSERYSGSGLAHGTCSNTYCSCRRFFDYIVLVEDFHESDLGDLLEALDTENRPRLIELLGATSTSRR